MTSPTPSSMIAYVLGFAVNPDGTEVLLILKNRPAWAKGRWNGVGGKVEAGETATQAMVREFAEETGLVWPAEAWQPLGAMTDGTTYRVDVFAARGDLSAAQSLTDEAVAVQPVGGLGALVTVPDFSEHLDRLIQGGWIRL